MSLYVRIKKTKQNKQIDSKCLQHYRPVLTLNVLFLNFRLMINLRKLIGSIPGWLSKDGCWRCFRLPIAFCVQHLLRRATVQLNATFMNVTCHRCVWSWCHNAAAATGASRFIYIDVPRLKLTLTFSATTQEKALTIRKSDTDAKLVRGTYMVSLLPLRFCWLRAKPRI